MKINRLKKIGLLFLLGLLLACDPPLDNGSDDSNGSISQNYKLPYDIDTPTLSFKLSNKLREISGLSMSDDGLYLLAVNDEKGRIYYINKATGAIFKDYPFHKNGDYEGVEMVGNMIYAMQSNGTLYEFKAGTERDNMKFPTKLKTENDVEGLGYFAAKNALILACKGRHGGGKVFKGNKTFHLFDLATKSLAEDPIFGISDQQLKQFLAINSKENNKVLNALRTERIKQFAPSAIAQHPISKDWYVLSSIGKMLVVIDQTGALKQIQLLNKLRHLQPEGLCFDKNGDMYIANEAKQALPKIFVYAYIK